MSIAYENYIIMLEGVRDVLTSSGFNNLDGTSADFKYCTNKSNKLVYYKCMMLYFKKLVSVLQYKLMECDRTSDKQKCKEVLNKKIKEYNDNSEKYKKLYNRELEDNVKLESSPTFLQKHDGSTNRRVYRENRRRNKRVVSPKKFK